MEDELKFILPLVGVLVGWILSTLATLMKERGENRRLLARAIVQLDSLNQEKSKLIRHLDFLKDITESWKDFEVQRKKAWDKYVLPEGNYKTALTVVEDVSSLYPLIGIKLKHLVESHLFSRKMKFEASIAKSESIYLKLLSAFEVTFELEQKELEKILFKLCLRHGIVTWTRMKFEYARMKKNVSNANASGFPQNLLSQEPETKFSDDIEGENNQRTTKPKLH